MKRWRCWPQPKFLQILLALFFGLSIRPGEAVQMDKNAHENKTTQESKNAESAAAKLAIAEVYQQALAYDEARKALEAALAADPGNAAAREKLAEVIAAQNKQAIELQSRQLELAEWEIENDSRDKAREIAQSILKSANDPAIATRALEALHRSQPGWWTELWEKVKPMGWAVVFILVLYCLLQLLRNASLRIRKRYLQLRVWYRKARVSTNTGTQDVTGNGGNGPTVDRQPPAGTPSLGNARLPWRVQELAEPANLGMSQLVTAAFSKLQSSPPAPLSSGLLKLESLALPPTLLFELESRPSVDLSEAAQALQLKIGGVELGGVIKFLISLRRWFDAKLPAITGTASVASDSKMIVRLTSHGDDGTMRQTSFSATPVPGSDWAASAADSVAFKMYYLLANPQATEPEAHAALAVREGLGLLQRYVSGQDGNTLEEAVKKFQLFRAARPDSPAAYEACLYEGVTLDLLERHDEALVRFQHVVQNAQQTELQDKATYNEAVAYMRKYRPDALKKAQATFDQLISHPPKLDVLEQPVRVLAKAGKANVIAHYPIFWRQLLDLPPAQNDMESRNLKRIYKSKLEGWIHEVMTITGELTQNLSTIKQAKLAQDLDTEEAEPDQDLNTRKKPKSGKSRWDAMAVRQLEWAIGNACGNVYLNFATGFLEPPRPADFTEEYQAENLNIALREFQKCEMLLPPGVETLANCATALLFLNRYDESRTYAKRAIELNPDYEYAYFRLAQSWDRQNRPDQAVQVLKGYKKTVNIPEFKNLFQKYNRPLPS